MKLAVYLCVLFVLPGSTGGFNNEARDRDIPFTAKDEPATLPRVTDLIIITELSPWCTIVHNDRGVTTGDVCGTIWKESVSRVLLWPITYRLMTRN